MSTHVDSHGSSATTASKLLFTATEAASLLGIGRSTVYELIASKRLESVTIGTTRRIPADALDAFVKSLRSGV